MYKNRILAADIVDMFDSLMKKEELLENICRIIDGYDEMISDLNHD